MLERANQDLNINYLLGKEGNHEARITILESDKLQAQQAAIGLRAELNGMVTDHKAETHNYIQRIETKMDATEAKMEAIWDTIAIKLNTLQKFQWTIVVGGGVVAAMVVGLVIIGWQILTNHDQLQWLWAK